MEKPIEDMTDEEYALFLEEYFSNIKAIRNISIKDLI